MAHASRFHSELGRVFAHYHAGDLSFDAAAHALASILRTHYDTTSPRLQIKELALSEWAHEQPPYISPTTLMGAIGRHSPIDEFKTDTLWKEACRLAGLPGGDAA